MFSQMEFFVVADSSVADDRLWSHKYKLNLKMLPTFISMYSGQLSLLRCISVLTTIFVS